MPRNGPQEVPERQEGETLTNWRLRALEKKVESLEAEIGNLRKVLLTFAITVSGGSIIFALGVAQIT